MKSPMHQTLKGRGSPGRRSIGGPSSSDAGAPKAASTTEGAVALDVCGDGRDRFGIVGHEAPERPFWGEDENVVRHVSAPPPSESNATERAITASRTEFALAHLAWLDLVMVRIMTVSARPRFVKLSAVALSRFGNGSLYVILSILVLARLGRGGLDVIAIAACNIALLHVFYPAVKRRVGRPRPFHVDHTLSSPVDVLDEHSFPSGHVMTLTATLVPITYADPGSTVYLTGLLAAMAWARMASAHHYPSDVLAGAVFACAIGYPITLMCFGRF